MASRTMLFMAILCVAGVFQMVNSETVPRGVSISFPPSNKFGCYFDPAQTDDLGLGPAKPEDICTVDITDPSQLILSYDGGVTSARYQYKTKVQLWKKNSKYVASFNAYFVVNFNRDVEFTQRPLFSGGGVAFAFTPDTTGVVGTGQETFGLFPINEQTGASLRGAATKTVAVEMDLSRISNVGFDPLAPHVGLDINSMKSVKTKYLGDANTVIDVKHGVWIEYDALTKTLKVYLHKVKENQTPNRRNANIAITYKGLDLAKEVNEFSYVGFGSRVPETTNGVYVLYDFQFSTKWVLGNTVNK